MQKPTQKNIHFISPIWLLPLIALCIGGWLLYISNRDAGIDIIIHFSTAEGITPGKTQVMYKGFAVGTVKSVEIAPDLQGIDLHVEMDKNTRISLVKDTKFWVVRPEVSAGRIAGLETLFSGAYVAIKRGKSSTECLSFVGLDTPPPLDTDAPGLHLTLKSPSLYSLQRGSRIYSKNLKIGIVEDYTLDKEGKINLQIRIKPEFSHLIHEGTRFWNASGISVNGDLQSGLTVNMESLASLVYGGISCATPDALQDSPPSASGYQYTLYKDYEDAEYGIPMTLQLATGSGIVAGKTKVVYRGLKAGVVKSLDINKDAYHTVTATILLDPRAGIILKEKTRFWVIRPQVSIEGIKNLETLISGTYITFQVGDGQHRDHFVVETEPMPIPSLRPGTKFVLMAEDSGSLSTGTPVFFKKQVVGKITDISFVENGQKIQTTIFIYEPFDRLVSKKSIFWNVSGVQVFGGLSDFRINVSSVRSLLTGGISFMTPGSSFSKKRGSETISPFHLYESFFDATSNEKALQAHGLSLQVQTERDASVRVGAPVLFNSIKIGEVKGLSLSRKTRKIAIDLLVYQKFRYLISGSSRFYTSSGVKATASLQGISMETGPLSALFSGAISLCTVKHKSPMPKDRIFPLYASLHEAENVDGVHLTLHLSSAKGIGVDTQIRYQGLEIGRITAVDFTGEMNQVIASAVVKKQTKKLFVQNSVLYMVNPQISFSGIKNLDTILKGSYISLHPGNGVAANEFVVLTQAPDKSGNLPGLHITLEATTRGSLKPGSPIYYRQVPVGSISGYDLSPTGQQVWIKAHIQPGYEYLIHKGTKFWNVSGVQLDGGVFSSLSITTESLEALISGGVALATPSGREMGEQSSTGDHFYLAEKAQMEWKDWAPNLKAVQHAHASQHL